MVVAGTSSSTHIYSLTSSIVVTTLVVAVIINILEVLLHVIHSWDALKATNNVLKALSFYRHLLAIGVISKLLMTILMGCSASHLVLHSTRASLAPSLLLLLLLSYELLILVLVL